VPAESSTTGSILVRAYDGTRQPIAQGTQLLIRVIDGNQTPIATTNSTSPFVVFDGLPFHDNLADNYTVIASAGGYKQAGYTPVKISPGLLQTVDLMLLPQTGALNFRTATWTSLQQADPAVAALLAQGAASTADAQDRYEQLLEQKPLSLACLLNLLTAMRDIDLPQGSPLAYLKQVIWRDDPQAPDAASPAQDRFYAWADQQLVDQVKIAARQGEFAPEINPSFFHPGATSSYKQVQFGEANVQLTFHERDTRQIDGGGCILVEADMDYYKDVLNHALLEVLPNAASGGLTDPRVVYVLRWIAGRHAGVPEFNPPYVIA
jgi:hypothetical protein